MGICHGENMKKLKKHKTTTLSDEDEEDAFNF